MSHHIIRQHKIEINAFDKSKTQEIFNEMSRLFNHRVKDVTGYLFDKHDSEDLLIKIDSLEVDMGVIPFPVSENNFVKIYSEKLEEVLLQLLKRKEYSRQLQETNDMNMSPALNQLLEHYLLTGTITWWANTNELKDPEYVFRKLKEQHESVLKTTIINLFGKQVVRKRLVYSFQEEYIRLVIRFIKPTDEVFILQYHAEVSQLHMETNFVRTENSAFRKELWLFIFDFLADHAGTHFNRKMFVKYTLKSIANRFNMSIEQVLFYFIEAAKTIPIHFKRTGNLVSIIEEIAIEIEQEKYGNIQYPNETLTINDSNALSELTYPMLFFLANGFIPLKSKNEEYEPEIKLMEEVNANQSLTRNFFKTYGKEQVVRTRLITHFSESAIKAVVTIVEPAGAETIFSYSDFTNTFQRKNNLIQSEEKVFKQSLWELILSYLFVDMGSVFNAKMFLISNIQALARHYNMAYRKLLAILAQAVGQTISLTSNQTGLFYLLTEILSDTKELAFDEEISIDGSPNVKTLSIYESAKDKNEGISGDKNQGIKTFSSKESANAQVNISSIINQIMEEDALSPYLVRAIHATNIFLHFLEYGEMPWWLEKSTHSAENIIKKLIQLYPDELKNSLILASKKHRVGVVFLEKYAKILRAELIGLVDKTGLYRNIYSYVQQFIAINHILVSIDVLFLKAAITSLNKSADDSLDLKLFFESIFEYTGFVNDKELKNRVIPKSNLLNESHLEKIHQAFDAVSTSYFPKINQNQFTYSHKTVEFLLKQLATRSGNLSYNDIIQLLPKWISGFLKTGTLPEFTNGSIVLTQSAFMAWSMEFLLHTNKEALFELLSPKNTSLEQLIVLLKIINEAGVESQVRIVIENQIQQQLRKDEYFPIHSSESVSWQKIIADLTSKKMSPQMELFWGSVIQMQNTRSIAVQYLNDQTIEVLFNTFNQPKLMGSLQTLRRALLDGITDHFEREQFRKWITEFFLSILGEKQQYAAKITLAKQFAIFLHHKAGLNEKTLLAKLKKYAANERGGTSENEQRVRREWLNQLLLLDKINESTDHLLRNLKSEEEQLSQHLFAEKAKAVDSELPNLTETKNMEEEKKQIMDDGQVYIANAGMVLLHPFIPTLFARAGLMNDKIFMNKHSQAKAALLLQYAVTGKEQSFEHELVLNKILIGMPVEDVLDINIALTDEDKELTREMIKAIMQQWDKMKNTSLEGFTQSFLLREGYIYQKDDAWVLRVEQRAYDLLLDTIPWSFRMIKFSWMNKPLNIEWT